MSLTGQIAQRLAPLRPTALEITDDSSEHAGHAGAAAGGGHFSLLVVSESFRGLSRVGRHQAVYRLLADLVPQHIHALSIRALAPEEL
jgi:BolA protein